jgi:predicted dehydrogenase
MPKIKFGIVGPGWRSLFYLRIAKACPRQFEVTGLVARNPGKGLALEKEWGIRTFRNLGQMLKATRPDFVVSSVPWGENPGALRELALAGMPALSETPPAPDLPGLSRLYRDLKKLKAKVQVAEQYFLRPMHAAQLLVAQSGLLGPVWQAQVSVAHGYHGLSLMRKFLGLKFENALISGHAFHSKVVQGPGRDGFGPKEKLVGDYHESYRLEFEARGGTRLGLFDFSGAQYFSIFHHERIMLRGERGELLNEQVSHLEGHKNARHFELKRLGGDPLDSSFLKGVQAGPRLRYRNPFAPAALGDDEIAVAACLLGMQRYLKTGKDFYSLAEGCQDHYLYLMSQKAVRTGKPVRMKKQVWANS